MLGTIFTTRSLPYFMQRASWPNLVPLSMAFVLALSCFRYPVRSASQQDTTLRSSRWVQIQAVLLFLVFCNLLCGVFLPTVRTELLPEFKASPDSPDNAPRFTVYSIHTSPWEIFALLDPHHAPPPQVSWSLLCTALTAFIAQLAVARIAYIASGRFQGLFIVNYLTIGAAFVYNIGVFILPFIRHDMIFGEYINLLCRGRTISIISDSLVWYALDYGSRTATNAQHRVMAAELLVPCKRAWWIDLCMQVGLSVYRKWGLSFYFKYGTVLARTLTFGHMVFVQNARVAVFFVMLRTYLQRLPFDQSEDEGPALVIAEKDENQPLESEGNGGDQKVSN